jgi:hypothetical protein
MPLRNQKGMGLLDSVIILMLACMVVLLVLWLSSQLHETQRFGKLPDWLTKAASSVWTYLTGAASSTVLALARRRSGDPTPNYLLWILGTAVVLLLIVFGVGAIPQAKNPPNVLLKFSLRFTRDRPNLSFFQRRPSYRATHTIGPEEDGHYQEYVDFPAPEAGFYARAQRAVTISQLTNDPVSQPTEFCFRKNPRPPRSGTPLEVHMDCPEGMRCSMGRDDPGWVELCAVESDWSVRNQFVSIVYADASQVQSGWKVPSLETLRAMTERERVGYTEFSIQSKQPGALKEAESVQYLIKVNGSPLYVDGWAPQDMLKPFDAATDNFTFSFGLENLSFSGGDNGCENIEVELQFRQKDRVIKNAVITRKYAALRDASPEEVNTEDGTTFTWSGRYVKPKKEDRTELFVLSTPNVQEAKDRKERIDAAKLSYDGRDVVAVLRPPLDNSQYGIVVGLRELTGQIRFTFDTAFAQKFHDWIVEQQAHDKKLFHASVFLYSMRLGDSGTGLHKSCSAAARKP